MVYISFHMSYSIIFLYEMFNKYCVIEVLEVRSKEGL